jgi:hypothetical protein
MASLAACGGFIRHQAAGPTAEIFARAQPALSQENDYALAAAAIPGALKTIEGVYVADEQPVLLPVLASGYCEYAIGWVDDSWEIAMFAHKLDEAAEYNESATKMFARCMNYSLQDLGAAFQKDLFGTFEAASKRIAATGIDQRTALMWAAVGLGGMVSHNLSSPEMISYVPTVKAMFERVIAIDKAHPPKHCDSLCVVHLALPHAMLGILNSAAGAKFGGDAKRATDEFQQALTITGDKLLLARTMYGYRVGKMTNDRKLFHDQLVKVLQTDPAVWPEQRLRNEVAQRRARRYLSHEKEWFQ